jgi:hypothetical protein
MYAKRCAYVACTALGIIGAPNTSARSKIYPAHFASVVQNSARIAVLHHGYCERVKIRNLPLIREKCCTSDKHHQWDTSIVVFAGLRPPIFRPDDHIFPCAWDGRREQLRWGQRRFILILKDSVHESAFVCRIHIVPL